MLDFSHILNTPNADIQLFMGQTTTTFGGAGSAMVGNVWKKPRGIRYVYMWVVGGGSSGGCAINTTTSSGGGAGGGSGASAAVWVPAMFVPDVLYIQAGQGGAQPDVLVSGAVPVPGLNSLVTTAVLTDFSRMQTFARAVGSSSNGIAPTATAGGTSGSAAAQPTTAQSGLAGRGYYVFYSGIVGAAGGSSADGGITGGTGVSVNYLTLGSNLMAGAGGGGSGTGASGSAAGGGITGVPTNGDAAQGTSSNFPTIAGGYPSLSPTPAQAGAGGTMLQLFQFTGGTGGGAASTVAGGVAGNGGNGGPGCGGGGAGGSNTTNSTLARPGDGGPGFVLIISW